MNEPTNWNIQPRHPHKPAGRPRKRFLRPADEPEPLAQPFIPEEAVRTYTPQELLVKSFVLGGLVLLLWGVHEPALLEQFAQRIRGGA